MATTEGYINKPSLKKEGLKKKGLLQSARAKIVATGIATAIGLGGIGYVSQNRSNENPEPTPISGGVVTPSEAPSASIRPIESAAATPSETQSPSPSPTEKPLPGWINEIPKSELNIDDVPLAKETIEEGAMVYTPLPGSDEYIMSNQLPTLVAVEANEEGIWIAVSLKGKKLTVDEKTINIDDKEKNFYRYEGVTIWYFIDENTGILLKENDSEKRELLGNGPENAAKYLNVGNSLPNIFSAFTSTNSENVELIKMNSDTVNNLNTSGDDENNRSNKEFKMYASTITFNK